MCTSASTKKPIHGCSHFAYLSLHSRAQHANRHGRWYSKCSQARQQTKIRTVHAQSMHGECFACLVKHKAWNTWNWLSVGAWQQALRLGWIRLAFRMKSGGKQAKSSSYMFPRTFAQLWQLNALETERCQFTAALVGHPTDFFY